MIDALIPYPAATRRYPRVTNGLDAMIQFFLREVQLLADDPPDQLHPDNPHFDFVVR